MQTVTITLKDEYIRLGQALKAAHIADSGVDAKYKILGGDVLVNGQKEFQRGKKLRGGDEVICGDCKICISDPV